MTLCTFGPPTERARYWILKFEDRDVDDLHFTVEPDAMRAFERYSNAYTCTLFVTAEFVDYDRKVITNVYNWANGMTMVFDQFGEQMPEFQGRTHEVMPKIRAAGFTENIPISVWPAGRLLSRSGKE